jgi:hypothetical protein
MQRTPCLLNEWCLRNCFPRKNTHLTKSTPAGQTGPFDYGLRSRPGSCNHRKAGCQRLAGRAPSSARSTVPGPDDARYPKPREMPRHLPLGPRSREAKTPFRQQIGATATMPHLGPFKFSAEVPEQGAGTDAAERGTATPGLEGDRPEKEQETFRLRRIPPSVLGPVLDNRMRCASATAFIAWIPWAA